MSMGNMKPLSYELLPRANGLCLLIAKQGDAIVAFETFNSQYDAEKAKIVAQSAVSKILDSLQHSLL